MLLPEFTAELVHEADEADRLARRAARRTGGVPGIGIPYIPLSFGSVAVAAMESYTLQFDPEAFGTPEDWNARSAYATWNRRQAQQYVPGPFSSYSM